MNIGTQPLLSLENIRKEFPGCIANDGVNLKIMPGQIHALLGENGAGKSTLVKMIYGVLKPDFGEFFWNGEKVVINSPFLARQMGIGMVFQHFLLFDAMTVEENIAIGISSNLSKGSLAQQIKSVSQEYGLPLDPKRHVHTLSMGERQRLEVVRCLLQSPQLLIMDEPTSVLTPQESNELFKTLRRLSEEGKSILYISHKLQEIKELCHIATIMRGGKVVVECIPKDESARSMAEMMMGSDLKVPVRRSKKSFGPLKLVVENVSAKSSYQYGIDLKSVNMAVRAGEILGIAGIAGNGQKELLEVLSGEVRLKENWKIKISDKSVGLFGPNERRKEGMVFVPEERLGHGAVPVMSLWENTLLSDIKSKQFLRWGFVNIKNVIAYTKKIIEKFNVKATSTERAASSLSGGNLQKFIFGREILKDPSIIIALQPTWGVDAGSAVRIRQSLIDLAVGGAGVLVISQDLEELLEISDTVSVINSGTVTNAFPISNITVETIGLLMSGIDQSNSSMEEAANH